jgi:hypothetical protein
VELVDGTGGTADEVRTVGAEASAEEGFAAEDGLFKAAWFKACASSAVCGMPPVRPTINRTREIIAWIAK